jgi:aspartate ammonia-lyase
MCPNKECSRYQDRQLTERTITEFRLERDALGEVAVPVGALFGAHTVRAVENFGVSGEAVRQRPDLVAAFGFVKSAAAQANAACGVLDERIAAAIRDAAREVARGEHDDQFPIDLVHGGGGTAVHMNVNEVIANLANERLGGRRGDYHPVHPNDHVNRSQSTNDVFPTALGLATVAVGGKAISCFEGLATTLMAKAAEAAGVERLGRTCLQDAVPLTVAQTHAAQAHAVTRTAAALERSLDALLAVPLGATAIGTGIGSPPGYRDLALRFLARESGLEARGAEDLFDALANLDVYVGVAAQVVRVSLVMAKIAADLRLLASGAVGEVRLPAVQVGSSIMPGKANPVIPELVMQVSYEARGMATVVEAAVAAGELELNAMEPVIARHLLGSLHDVGRTAQIFADRCIAGLEWNEPALRGHLAGSLGGVVESAAELGYSQVSGLARADYER